MSASYRPPGSWTDLIRTERKARGAVVAVVAVQLLSSVQFFFKYVDVLPGLAYTGYVAAGLVLCLVVLTNRRLLEVMTRGWMLALGLGSLLAMLAVVYPRADALRAVGRGSDQDDCVRTLVANLFALRAPYGRGYFGDPCSTGPTEFLVYFPVQVSDAYFALVPVLTGVLGYWVLRQVSDPRSAVLLSLTQLLSLVFLEMSAVGSDMVVIGWLFALATVTSRKGLIETDTRVVILGSVGYCLFAGSRVPLTVVTLASMWILLVSIGPRALRVILPAVLATAVIYLGTYAAGPSSFQPWHLVEKSGRILQQLGGGLLPFLVVVAAIVGLLTLSTIHGGVRSLLERHYFAANFVVIVLPMAAVAIWGLTREHLDFGRWEGLHYLFISVPSLLVMMASGLHAMDLRSPQGAGKNGPGHARVDAEPERPGPVMPP